MADLDALLPKLKRFDDSALTESDIAKLREFHEQYMAESDTELERKRGIMRERCRIKGYTVSGPEGTQHIRKSRWDNPHLDAAKHEILTAIIQDRTRAKLLAPAPRKEEIVQLKPGLWGINVDVKALWRRVIKRKA